MNEKERAAALAKAFESRILAVGVYINDGCERHLFPADVDHDLIIAALRAYSEPLPTDIREAVRAATMIERNRCASICRSAAAAWQKCADEARDRNGLFIGVMERGAQARAETAWNLADDIERLASTEAGETDTNDRSHIATAVASLEG